MGLALELGKVELEGGVVVDCDGSGFLDSVVWRI
jgi:hypothetical protein